MAFATNFKGPRVTTAKRRARKSARLKRGENKNKEIVRDRDVICRFPLCLCSMVGLFAEVSHRRHKGMGGDPTGERSATGLMLLVCNARHKDSKVSIDKGTVRWEPLTAAGADGPIVWWIDLGAISDTVPLGTWFEVGRETVRGRLAPSTDVQRNILYQLRIALKDRFS